MAALTLSSFPITLTLTKKTQLLTFLLQHRLAHYSKYFEIKQQKVYITIYTQLFGPNGKKPTRSLISIGTEEVCVGTVLLMWAKQHTLNCCCSTSPLHTCLSSAGQPASAWSTWSTLVCCEGWRPQCPRHGTFPSPAGAWRAASTPPTASPPGADNAGRLEPSAGTWWEFSLGCQKMRLRLRLR